MASRPLAPRRRGAAFPAAARRSHWAWPALAALIAALPCCSSALPLSRLAVVVAGAPAREALLAAANGTWVADAATLVVVTPGAGVPHGAPPAARWFTYPDRSTDDGARAAAALRIAHEALNNTYDWLALGTDETVWWLDAVASLVEGLDPNVPAVLSDVSGGCGTAPRCKLDPACSLPRDSGGHGGSSGAQAAGGGAGRGCVRAPAAAPCTPAALSAPGVCAAAAAAGGVPAACPRNGLLVSRGLLSAALSAANASRWRSTCEQPGTAGSSADGGERLFACFADAGAALTDPTPGDDPSWCAFGWAPPAELLQSARRVAADNGTCDAACDRALHRTVSVAVDAAAAGADAAAAAARELWAAVATARDAAARARLAALPAALAADAAALVAERTALGAGPGSGAGVVVTLTNGGHGRWRLFLNWLAHAVALRLPLLVVTTDPRTQRACEAALARALRDVTSAPPPPPSLCFHPVASLRGVDLSARGGDAWKHAYWQLVVTLAKPAALALAHAAAAASGGDVLFAETDVVLRDAGALPFLAARPANVTITCAVAAHNASAPGALLPGANVGVLFLRGADAHLPPLLAAHAARCAAAKPGTVNDQSELITALMALEREVAGPQGAPPAGGGGAASASPRYVECVDSSHGFTTACCAYNASARFSVHAAGATTTDDKVEWLRRAGLWANASWLAASDGGDDAAALNHGSGGAPPLPPVCQAEAAAAARRGALAEWHAALQAQQTATRFEADAGVYVSAAERFPFLLANASAPINASAVSEALNTSSDARMLARRNASAAQVAAEQARWRAARAAATAAVAATAPTAAAATASGCNTSQFALASRPVARLSPALFPFRPNVSFVLQFFRQPLAIGPILEYYHSCTRGMAGDPQNPGLTSEFVAHVDSPEDAAAWAAHMAPGSPYAGFVSLVVSNNVHEIRGYNRGAALARGDTLVLLQDDDAPRGACDWLSNLTALLAARPRIGAVALKKACIMPNDGTTCRPAWDDKAVRYMDPRVAGGLQYQYVALADFAPLAYRTAAYADIGGGDEGAVPPGESGIMLDYEMTLRTWAAGWHVAQMRAPCLKGGAVANGAPLKGGTSHGISHDFRAKNGANAMVNNARFSEADLYDVFLEVRRKNSELTPLPEYTSALEKMYADSEQRLAGGMSPDARAAAAARLALLAAARNDTSAAA